VLVIRGLHHASRTVRDLEHSLAFYRDLLGLGVVADEELAGQALDRVVGLTGARLRVVELDTGDGRLLELIQYHRPPGRAPAAGSSPADVGAHHVALVVDDLAAVHRRLVAAGVPFNCPPQEVAAGLFRGARTTYCLDPDGLVVELWQPARQAAHQEPITTGGENA
jgi:catechol 2,3-dioxygenase-like lactoylglutathione lyase family enzyme